MTKLQQHQITDTMRFEVVFGAMIAEVLGQPLSPLQEAIKAATNAEVPASLEGLRNAIDAVLLEQQPAGLPMPAPVRIVATAAQLMTAIEAFAPDWETDPDQRDTTIRLMEGDETSHSGPGLYACDDEYPEEGAIALFDQPDSDEAAAQQAEAQGVELAGDAPQEPEAQVASWPFPSGNRGPAH